MPGAVNVINHKLYNILQDIQNLNFELSGEHFSTKNNLYYPDTFWKRMFPGSIIAANIDIIQNQINNLAVDIKRNLDNAREEHCDVMYIPVTEPIDIKVEDEIRIGDLSRETDPSENNVHPSVPETTTPDDIENSALVRDIIKLRDQTLIFAGTTGQEAAHLATSIYKELGRILLAHGIQSIEEIGVLFNHKIHLIEEIRDTTDPSWHDVVAETFRPGYRTVSDIMRPHEVILYQYKPETVKE